MPTGVNYDPGSGASAQIYSNAPAATGAWFARPSGGPTNFAFHTNASDALLFQLALLLVISQQVASDVITLGAGGGATPVSDTDASGSATEAAALTAALTGSDASGPDTEATALAAALADSDSSGASTETASVAVPVAGSDASGTDTETAALAAALAASDADGPATEAGALGVAASVPDASGPVTETAALTAQEPASDTDGPVTEQGAPAARLTASDSSGTDTENATISVPTTAADTSGPTTELASVQAGQSVAGSDSNGPATEFASVTVTTPTLFTPGASRIRGRGLPPERPTRREVLAHDAVKLDLEEIAVVRDLTAEQRRAEEELLLVLA